MNKKVALDGMYITENSVYIVMGEPINTIYKNGLPLVQNIKVYLDNNALTWEHSRTTKIQKYVKIIDRENLKNGLTKLGERLCNKVPNKEEYINKMIELVRNKERMLSKIKGLPIPECPSYKVYKKEDYEYAAVYMYISTIIGFDLSTDRDFSKIINDMCINYYGFAEIIERIALEENKTL